MHFIEMLFITSSELGLFVWIEPYSCIHLNCNPRDASTLAWTLEVPAWSAIWIPALDMGRQEQRPQEKHTFVSKARVNHLSVDGLQQKW